MDHVAVYKKGNMLKRILPVGINCLFLVSGLVPDGSGDFTAFDRWKFTGNNYLTRSIPAPMPNSAPSDWPRVAGWAITEVVTNESSISSFAPSVDVEPDGTVHTAWSEYTYDWPANGDYAIFYKKRTSDGIWGDREYVSTESYSAAYRPSLAVDADGTVHVVWEDETYGGYDRSDIFYKKKPSDGEWTATELLTIDTDMGSAYPSLVAGVDGTVHVVWSDETDIYGSGEDWDIYYSKKLVDGDWSETELVSSESEGNSWMPSMDVENDGTVHVSWTDLPFGEVETINYKKKPPGDDWMPVESIFSEPVGLWDSFLAVDAIGTVHAVWLYWNSVLYKKKPSGCSWTEEEDISVDGYQCVTPALAIDQENTVHVGFIMYRSNENPQVFYRKRRAGANWTSAEMVSTESAMTLAMEDLDIAIDPAGKVHVVWYDNTDYNGAGGDADIFYKQKYETPRAGIPEDMNTIVVPDDYPTIQDAIDHAIDGNTIFVRRGTYEEKIVVDKSIHLVGENRSNTIIDGSDDYENIVTLSADNVLMTNFTVQNSNRKGIYTNTNHHTITGNKIINTEIAVYLEYSIDNTVSENTVWSNDDFGIYVKNSSNCIISDNIIIDNHYAGIAMKDYSAYNIFVNNIIALSYCYEAGISIWNYPHDNIFTDNTITDNCYGIHMCKSTGNIIINNNFTNNRWGIRLYLKADDSMIYHNNFSDNITNASDGCNNTWDNGYPSGGNYWDDYTGSDNYSGPDQNIPAPDGIGDVPYGFEEEAEDDYPLMEPWDGFEVYIIDNSDPQFHILTGTWDCANHPYAYNSEARFTGAGFGNRMAVWKVDSVLDPGVYEVFVWKFEHGLMEHVATNVHYAVCDLNGISDWIIVDQSTPGNEWISLGTFEFDNSFTQGVLINDNADGFVMADAVKLVFTGSIE